MRLPSFFPPISKKPAVIYIGYVVAHSSVVMQLLHSSNQQRSHEVVPTLSATCATVFNTTNYPPLSPTIRSRAAATFSTNEQKSSRTAFLLSPTSSAVVVQPSSRPTLPVKSGAIGQHFVSSYNSAVHLLLIIPPRKRLIKQAAPHLSWAVVQQPATLPHSP